MSRTVLMFALLAPTLATAGTLQLPTGDELATSDPVITCEEELDYANGLVSELDEALGICDKELLYTESLLADEQDAHAVTQDKLDQYMLAYRTEKLDHATTQTALEDAQTQITDLEDQLRATHSITALRLQWYKCLDLDTGDITGTYNISGCDDTTDLYWMNSTHATGPVLAYNAYSEAAYIDVPFGEVTAHHIADAAFCTGSTSRTDPCSPPTSTSLSGGGTVLVRTNTDEVYKMTVIEEFHGHTYFMYQRL